MIPNKPSILVAPNGSGKSSFAFAFQWLNRKRMKLNKDDAYMGDENNKPSMIIEVTDPVDVLQADESKNEIVKCFDIFVINSSLMAVAPGMSSGLPMGKAHVSVPEVVLIDKIPDNIQVIDDFETVYSVEKATVGYYPVITALLENNSFMAGLDIQSLRCTKIPTRKIENFIERTKRYSGTVDERHLRIETEDYPSLIMIPAIANAIDSIRKKSPEDREAKLLLKAIRLVTLCARKGDQIEKRIAYTHYKKEEQDCREMFAALKQTWNDTTIHKVKDKLSLRINDAQRISNGERDIMVFLANLYKAKSKFTKENNILIIDEVFDYLDDANLMAVQFYITGLIKQLKEEGKNIFPIILSHLNPDYYNQHYSFKDLKIYYLCPLPHPHASDSMIKLLRKRKELSQLAGPGNEEDISKYMLHYHNDYSKDMTDLIEGCPTEWGDINVFKKFCMRQLEKYFANEDYDPLAVCVALREIVESNICNSLTTEDQKHEFINSKHGTPKKLSYAEEHGVDVPELYYLLGNIYNDPMHIDNKSNKLITQTLYSRLENNTVRNMIKAVKENRF